MAALLAAAGALLALVLFGRVPGEALWAAEIQNFAHGPVFGALALIVIVALRRLRPGTPGVEFAIALFVTLALGALVEGVQALIGRDAEAGDLLRDALGAVAALGFLAFLERPVGRSGIGNGWRFAGLLLGVAATLALIAPVATCALAYRERELRFPVLADFDRPFATYFVSTHARASVAREALPSGLAEQADRRFGLRVRPGGKEWWGISLREPLPDWRAFESVGFAIANPAGTPLMLQARIFDGRYRSGDPALWSTAITVAPGSVAMVHVPLRYKVVAQKDTALDLSNVRSLMLSHSGRDRTPDFYVVRVWLE